jgi:uncharacterized protein YgbK (DUF1537 family)
LKNQRKAMAVIADDLTGANDTGLQFSRHGLCTEVLLEGAEPGPASEAAIIIWDTNSRAIDSQAAYDRVQTAVRQAHQAGFTRYYKKLDSTLRGNVGIEIKAILDMGLHDFAFVMPAFVQTGRTTVGGNHLVQGIPVEATEIARDPKCPVTESCLPGLLQRQAGLQVAHIGIAELTGGPAVIGEFVHRALAAGCRIISCDGWADEHFDLAARAVAGISSRVLWAGSAGLADCLPAVFNWNDNVRQQTPALVIAGSVSSVTRGQIAELLAGGCELVEIEVAKYLPWQEQNALPLLESISKKLAQGTCLVIATGYQPAAVEQTKAAGAKLGFSAVEVSEITATILGWIGAQLVRRQEVAGIVLTGGDTAVAVCRALGVTGIRILEEVTTAIPLGTMTTREGKTLKVITKAGAFGKPGDLLKAVRKLQQRK